MRSIVMRTSILASASLTALVCATPGLAQSETSPSSETVFTDIITVSAPRVATDTTELLRPDALPPAAPDTAGLVARLPGAALTANGPLSGQLQYRGLFGDRVPVRIDHQSFHSGGPNLMDPPLSYAPRGLVERIELSRGLAPVSDGPGLAGGANVVFKSVPFGSSDAFDAQSEFTLGYRSGADAVEASGLTGLANDRWVVQALASHESGGNIETPEGELAGTEHTRSVYGLGVGVRNAHHTVRLDLRRHETGDTGNPPFAMDIRYIDTDFAKLSYEGELGAWAVTAMASLADVDHAMNNFTLRPAPAMMMRYRETLATGETRHVKLDAGRELAGGYLTLGVDHVTADHAVTITNPLNADFFLTAIPDAEISRMGVFAEFEMVLTGWNTELGLRADHHEAEAGLATVGSAVPAMPGMLAMGFNDQDRSWDDTTFDAVIRSWRDLNDTTRLRVSLARKNRAPTYLDRFGWLPIPASAGLADGNTYVGDRDLETETALLIEAGVDWSNATAYVRPAVFYRQIENYIQGVPFDATPGVIDNPVEMVSGMNGDPTPLRFANTDAVLYGFDIDFGMQLSEHWRLDGVANYVRGERDDIDDNLYRIAPPNLRLTARYETARWSLGLETRAFAEQDEVSVTNSEAETPGYVLLGVFGEIALTDALSLSVSADNLLDHSYRDHMAGYNRNAASIVPVGERLLGEGRTFGLRLHWQG